MGGRGACAVVWNRSDPAADDEVVHARGRARGARARARARASVAKCRLLGGREGTDPNLFGRVVVLGTYAAQPSALRGRMATSSWAAPDASCRCAGRCFHPLGRISEH